MEYHEDFCHLCLYQDTDVCKKKQCHYNGDKLSVDKPSGFYLSKKKLLWKNKSMAEMRTILNLSPSQYCKAYQVQNCHCCDDIYCGDNMSEGRMKLIAFMDYLNAQYRELYETIPSYNGYEVIQMVMEKFSAGFKIPNPKNDGFISTESKREEQIRLYNEERDKLGSLPDADADFTALAKASDRYHKGEKGDRD